MHRRVKPALVLAAGLALLSLFACSNGAAQNGIETASVKRGDITRRVSADGRLAFVTTQSLAFGTLGKVAKVSVSEMDRVTKGQELARLDTTPLEQAVKAAELGVKTVEFAQKSAQADKTLAEYTIQTSQADLAHLQQTVKSVGIDLDTATDSFRKIAYPYTYSTFTYDVPTALGYIADASQQISAAEAGMGPGLTSDQYAQALTKLHDAIDSLTKGQQLLGRGQGQDVFAAGILAAKDLWTVRAAQQAMDKAKVTLEDTQGLAGKAALAVGSARASVAKYQVALDKTANDMAIARNNLDIARTNLDNAVIKAPFDGIVTLVNVKEGDVLSAVNYYNPAIQIIDPTRMELDIKVSEIDVPSVKVGQKVSLNVDALPGRTIEGTVNSVNPMPLTNTNPSAYQVKTVFSVPADSVLKAGMGATVGIVLDSRSNVVLAPVRAIKTDTQGKSTVTVQVNGKTEDRVVVLGLSDGRQTEIVSGLDAGQTIVLGKTMSLYDGPRSGS